MSPLELACHDILYKNMKYTDETVYFLYDTESPLAKVLSDSYIKILPEGAIVREFRHPPQPLYRGGFLNPENPHATTQNRVITAHNVGENIHVGLDHHKEIAVTSEAESTLDPQVESIKNDLIHLPKGAIVILVQSTNFRLSTFRIRLELFHRGVHVVEHNHLAYIPESQFPTFFDALLYRTDEYVRFEKAFADLIGTADSTQIISSDDSVLEFGSLEPIRGNTGDYTWVENKGGTFPIGEVFTEAKILSSVSGKVLIDTFPSDDFSIITTKPFLLEIEKGRVLPSHHFPPEFQKLYDWIVQYEGEVMVRELGFGLNPAISTSTPLADINFHERKVGVHLSLGKKHGIYGKKLPKTEIQRFHIDVFVDLKTVCIGDAEIFADGKWTL